MFSKFKFNIHKTYLNNVNYLVNVQDRVIGILDWELSTLGNQMCDVAFSCMVLIWFSYFTILHKKNNYLNLLWTLLTKCCSCNIVIRGTESYYTLAIDFLRSLLLYWQPYVVHMGLETEQPGKGLEIIGIPEGIPSQAEFLAEYCFEAESTTAHAFK